MTKKILVNATEEEESRVAVLKDRVLQEYYIERPSMGTCLGNIYKGRVSNIEPSIGAAFVDIGGPRNGFLHVSDINLGILENEALPSVKALSDGKGGAKSKKRKAKDDGKEKAEDENGKTKRKNEARIDKVLSVNQEVIVQVSKDGIGDKGPTLTTYLSLPGRFLVFMPGIFKRGISRKIKDEEERERLKNLVTELVTEEDVGMIVRTAGANQVKKELQKDYRYLMNIWSVIQKGNDSMQAPAPLYKENDLVIRVLRDVYSSDVSEVLIDSDEVYKRALEFMKIILPRHVDKVRLYQGVRPLFDHYKLEEEIESVLQPRINLKSGGSLFIEQTEALVAIDVNSGRFKAKELEETAYAINMEASREIARQLRLRDLGGLITIDFIDMKEPDHKRDVEKEFRDALKDDRARIKVAKISPFGVIEVTRQRVRPSLESYIYEKCPHCKGTGIVATSETLSLNMIRKIRRWVMQSQGPLLHIRINDRMAEYIQNSKRRVILGLEEATQKRIVIKGDPALSPRDIFVDEIELDADGQGVLFEEDGF